MHVTWTVGSVTSAQRGAEGGGVTTAPH